MKSRAPNMGIRGCLLRNKFIPSGKLCILSHSTMLYLPVVKSFIVANCVQLRITDNARNIVSRTFLDIFFSNNKLVLKILLHIFNYSINLIDCFKQI